VTIYSDALASDWDNWSWDAVIDLAGTSPVRVGTRAANVTLAAWGAFSPRRDTAIDTYGYAALKFWVHGGTGSNQVIRIYTQDESGSESTAVNVTAVANSWTEITVTLEALGNPATIQRLNFFNSSSSALTTITFDEIRLMPGTTCSPPAGLRVRR
jgi:hypothetical protein